MRPEVAIATASLGNRFDFPRPEIRRRYEVQGIEILVHREIAGRCAWCSYRIRPDAWEPAAPGASDDRVWRWSWPPTIAHSEFKPPHVSFDSLCIP